MSHGAAGPVQVHFDLAEALEQGPAREGLRIFRSGHYLSPKEKSVQDWKRDLEIGGKKQSSLWDLA